MNKKPLVVLTGPTASGKSSVGILLAQHTNGEIVSADSMQIYKGMSIGTAKALPQDWQGVPHHLLDFLDPEETFSVAQYVSLARQTIDDIHRRGKLPYLVGGTGLYIEGVVDNIQYFDLKEDTSLRKELTMFAQEQGNEALWERLLAVDPYLASQLHPNNQRRVIRGLEVAQISGKPLSYWQKKSRSQPSPYKTLLLGLAYKNRSILYEHIDQRVDKMLQGGLLSEIQTLYDQGLSPTSAQAIGYKELWPIVYEGKDPQECIDRLKQNTRNYAKRQLTWMRGRPDLTWLYKDEISQELLLENTKEQIDTWLND